MRLPGELLLVISPLMLCLGLVNSSGSGTGTFTGPEFLGGSMSFEAFDDQSNNILINAKILTGWRLGKGQCGVHCDHTNIGSDITAQRNNIMASTNQTYFGNWSVEEKYGTQLPHPRDVTTEANSNLTVQVMAINDLLGWELDKTEVTIKVKEAAEYTDFIYEGYSWTPLSKQPSIKQWHMQLKVNAKRRSDTNRRNRSPIVQITPFMTLGIDKTYTLSIPAIDQDGDYFECRKMAFIEFIDLQTSYHLKNIVIQKDCFIHINTSSPEYKVGDSAVIAVTLQDFNRENIKLTGDPHPLRQRYTIGRSLSAVPVQFYIEITLKDEAPVIIPPTPSEQQMFTVFVGSDLSIKVVAKPTNPTRTISTFFFTRRDGVVPLTSAVTDESATDPLAKGQTVLWTPVPSDMGDHILCVRVEDSAGGITGIDLISSDAAGSHASQIKDAHAIHAAAKMIDIAFQDSSVGSKKICLRASDATAPLVTTILQPSRVTVTPSSAVDPKIPGIRNVYRYDIKIKAQTKADPTLHICLQVAKSTDSTHPTDTKCFNIEYEFKHHSNDFYDYIDQVMVFVIFVVDHCASSPCKNGGVCGSNQGTFVCVCTAGYTGLSCEKGPCPTTSPPHCDNGGYCYIIGAKTNCFCKLGFSGPTCTQKSMDTVASPQINGSKFKDGALPNTVTCYVGQPCKIPTTLIGDPGSSPVVSPGYVSGDIDVQGTTVTKDPSSPTDYHASVELVSKTSGQHQICIQSHNQAGQSADEVCVMVNAVSGHLHLPSKSHAYYVDPTLPNNSSVECETGKPCHLSLWVLNYDGDDTCPSVRSSEKVYTGVFIHQATGTSLSGPCKVDVVFLNDAPKTYTDICFTATSAKHDVFGGDGEVRCYDVNVVNALSVLGSCSSTLCQNGGFCDGHRATSKCACLSGFSGPLCSQAHGESLTNPASISGVTQSTFGDLAVPKKIKCTLNQKCQVPFTFTTPGGSTSTLPALQLGQVDSGLNITSPSVSRDPNSPAGTYQGKINVVGNTPGNKKVCVHTPTSSHDIVGDEICFDVDVSAPTAGSTTPNTAQPHFIEPTVQPNSTVQCEPGKTCHVTMQMSPGINHGCPSVDQTQGPTDDLHLFHSDSSSVVGSCAVDIALTPPTSKQGTDTLCFETSLPYIPGESRCFDVEYTHIVPGPCHGVTCRHGGVCGANGQCVCPLDRSGPNCENSGNQGPVHTAATPIFTDMALPTNVKCEINKECAIPLMVNGAVNTM
ncbi:uncharacterized protein LOC132550472 [Ylistrum balloti]|uniref:uncharacterized protein LOC132550472 n=1 Tax=Ylistrum balloti TaxID=509963 RepID=UPI002905BE83|nr:uncharacterized protein LOC132550472 [Ylistrum balloti]